MPPNPKELTDALRRPFVGQGVGATGNLFCLAFNYVNQVEEKRTLMRRESGSIFGLMQRKFVLGGITARSSVNIVLITPAIPLAPSRCPMLLLTAPLQKCKLAASKKRFKNEKEHKLLSNES